MSEKFVRFQVTATRLDDPTDGKPTFEALVQSCSIASKDLEQWHREAKYRRDFRLEFIADASQFVQFLVLRDGFGAKNLYAELRVKPLDNVRLYMPTDEHVHIVSKNYLASKHKTEEFGKNTILTGLYGGSPTGRFDRGYVPEGVFYNPETRFAEEQQAKSRLHRSEGTVTFPNKPFWFNDVKTARMADIIQQMRTGRSASLDFETQGPVGFKPFNVTKDEFVAVPGAHDEVISKKVVWDESHYMKPNRVTEAATTLGATVSFGVLAGVKHASQVLARTLNTPAQVRAARVLAHHQVTKAMDIAAERIKKAS